MRQSTVPPGSAMMRHTMATPLKLLLDAAAVRRAGGHLQRAWPAFDRTRFERLALHGLAALEFKGRARHIADALQATLPADFARAADVLEASLAPPASSGDAGLSGWIGWPLGEFVARRGLDDPERALAVLHALTQRFTAEWAIRPFIERHPALAFATLGRWRRDPSWQVRRLCSEGTRPRLPWGMVLRTLIDDPSPTLPLLQALHDDPNEDVRRSVANHLNDIGRDHPQLLAGWIERHLPGASAERRALLKHASRTCIKRGDPRVLALWGIGAALRGEATLRLQPKRLAVGDTLTLTATLASTASAPQPLAIDYALHFVGARGGASPKVFKGWSIVLVPGERRRLVKRHSLRPITTRTYHAGRHVVELRVNGRAVADAAFTLCA
jgi:3-methyladenine DNA glycosylase AlkC